METASRSKLFKNVISLSLFQVVSFLLPLAYVPVIARILGPEKMGINSFADAFVAYFSMLITYSFDLTATRKLSKDPDSPILQSQVFNEVLGARALLFLVSFILFVSGVSFVPFLNKEKTVAIFTFLGCISFIFSQSWFFNATQDLPKLVLLNFAGRLLSVIAVLIFIRSVSDYIIQPLIVSTAGIAIAVISFFWIRKKYNIRVVRLNFSRIFRLLWAERAIFASVVTINLYTTTSTFMLGLMASPADVAYYVSAYKMMMIFSSVINIPMSIALFPYMGNAFGVSRKHGEETVKKIMPLVVILSVAAVTIMFISGPLLIKLIYGQAFIPAVPAFRVMAFIPLIIALSNIFGVQIMLNLKMDRPFFLITLSGAVLSLLLNYFLIRPYGFTGTACNWLAVELFIATSMYIVLRKKGINPFDKNKFTPASIIKMSSAILSEFKKVNQK